MSKNDDRTICFVGLKSGVYQYDFTLDNTFFEDCKNEEIIGGKVNFDVKMERMTHQIMFTFAFEGEVTTRCDRCLGEMGVRIEGEEHLHVRFSDTEVSGDEETVILPVSANEIDLTPWLYEFVAVRIPLQHMHPDGDCDPEMTRYIGTEESSRHEGETDPRWDALKELK